MKDEQNSTLRKIRMQYFNGIIYFIAITAVCIPIMRISSAIIDGAIVWSEIMIPIIRISFLRILKRKLND